MADVRAYTFCYLASSKTWGFIAMEGTNMKDRPVSFAPIETWTRENGEVYGLYVVCYSRARAAELIEQQSGRCCVALASSMIGPDIYQLLKGNEAVCVVWKPAATEGMIEIQHLSDRKYVMVDEKMPMDALIKEIQRLSGLNVKSVVHQSCCYHVLGEEEGVTTVV